MSEYPGYPLNEQTVLDTHSTEFGTSDEDVKLLIPENVVVLQYQVALQS
jgi:hypothetical protein